MSEPFEIGIQQTLTVNKKSSIPVEVILTLFWCQSELRFILSRPFSLKFTYSGDSFKSLCFYIKANVAGIGNSLVWFNKRIDLDIIDWKHKNVYLHQPFGSICCVLIVWAKFTDIQHFPNKQPYITKKNLSVSDKTEIQE